METSNPNALAKCLELIDHVRLKALFYPHWANGIHVAC